MEDTFDPQKRLRQPDFPDVKLDNPKANERLEATYPVHIYALLSNEDPEYIAYSPQMPQVRARAHDRLTAVELWSNLMFQALDVYASHGWPAPVALTLRSHIEALNEYKEVD